jgi:hypothetical protein
MHRLVGLLLALSCACAAAGCGGSSIKQAARQEAKELLGDPHARVVRVETVQIVNGTREAIVPMQGHFTVHPDCPAAAGGKASRCHTIHSHYAVLDFNLSNPKRSQGYWIPGPFQVASITRARSARPLFGIFPDFLNDTIRCDIPRGGSSSGTVEGTCSTSTDISGHTIRVRFIERWPRAGRPDGSWPAYEKSGGWIVTLTRAGHVQSIHTTGHLPPQLWQ